MSNRIDEFRNTYKRMPDEQLLDLAAELDQLTDEAQTALRDEIDRRGLAGEAVEPRESDPPRSDPPPTRDPARWSMMGERPPALPDSEWVAVFSAATESEAEQVQEALRDASIENHLEYVILVPQAQSEKASEVLSEQLGPDADPDDDADEEKQDG